MYRLEVSELWALKIEKLCNHLYIVTMSALYVVIENGDPYPHLYTSYVSAASAAQEKYKEAIEEEIKQADGYPICSEIDVPEDTSGTREYIFTFIN